MSIDIELASTCSETITEYQILRSRANTVRDYTHLWCDKKERALMMTDQFPKLGATVIQAAPTF